MGTESVSWPEPEVIVALSRACAQDFFCCGQHGAQGGRCRRHMSLCWVDGRWMRATADAEGATFLLFEVGYEGRMCGGRSKGHRIREIIRVAAIGESVSINKKYRRGIAAEKAEVTSTNVRKSMVAYASNDERGTFINMLDVSG